MNYIPLEQCKHGYLYRIRSRNLSFGVYNERARGFIGIRKKFDDKFLFTEFHWDTGPPFGTVCPVEELEKLPDEISVNEQIDTIDEITGRSVEFDKPIKNGGRGWYFLDTKEASEEIRPRRVSNKALSNWLQEKEQEYKDA